MHPHRSPDDMGHLTHTLFAERTGPKTRQSHGLTTTKFDGKYRLSLEHVLCNKHTIVHAVCLRLAGPPTKYYCGMNGHL